MTQTFDVMVDDYTVRLTADQWAIVIETIQDEPGNQDAVRECLLEFGLENGDLVVDDYDGTICSVEELAHREQEARWIAEHEASESLGSIFI